MAGGCRMIDNSRGSVLIFASWLLILFVLFVTSMGYNARMRARLVSRENEMSVMREKCLSAVSFARYVILNDSNPAVDSMEDEWYNEIPLSADVFPSRDLSISVVDEESKLNINKANERMLKVLFEELEVAYGSFHFEVEAFAEKIVGWRSLSSDKFEDFKLSDSTQAAEFESLYELFLVEEGMSSEVFDILKSYLTVYDNGETEIKINVNTAAKEVLYAVIMSAAGDERRKQEFFNQIMLLRSLEFKTSDSGDESSAEDYPYFNETDLAPYDFLQRLNISSDVIGVSLSIQLLQRFIVNSRIFNVSVIGSLKEGHGVYRVSAILGPSDNRSEDSCELDVLAWKENI